MHITDTPTATPQLIAAHRLTKSPLNARRTQAGMGMDELKASILAHGLMQNLVVTDAGDGHFRVIAGGRRLEAIRALQSEGRLPEEYAVPCQLVAEERAFELSLAENSVRLAMHPADQFEAFAQLIDTGATAAEVASRFGIEESLVLKRMKLARVAPELLAVYRDGGMTLECLMAFTVSDDHERQREVYASLRPWQEDDADAIRASLTEEMIEATSKLARFVGLDAYVAAGGITRADLFGEDVYLEDPELLQRLTDDKLSGIREELEADGWGWIEVNPERDWDAIYRCQRLQPRLVDAPDALLSRKSQLDAELAEIEHALDDSESDELLDQQEAIRDRLDEVEQQLAAFVGFEPEQKQLAGCYVSINSDGSPCLDKGLVRPEQRKQLEKLLNPDSGDEEPTTAKTKGPHSESLRRDLACYRLQAAQVEIAKHPAIALDLLTFRMASTLLDHRTPTDGPDILLRRGSLTAAVQKEPTAASEALTAIGRSLPGDWRSHAGEAERFAAFQALPQETRLKILAYCVALTLQPKLAPASGDRVTAYDAALASTGGDMASYWRPGKESYLSRVNRQHLLAIARDTLGITWAGARMGDKKALLVDQLDRAFAEPNGHGRSPEQAEKLKHWLPAGMAFGTAAAKLTEAA